MKSLFIILIISNFYFINAQKVQDSCEVAELNLYQTNIFSQSKNIEKFHNFQIQKNKVYNFRTKNLHHESGIISGFDKDSIKIFESFSYLNEYLRKYKTQTKKIAWNEINEVISSNFGSQKTFKIYNSEIKFKKIKSSDCYQLKRFFINDTVEVIKTIENQVIFQDSIYWFDGIRLKVKKYDLESLTKIYNRRHPKIDSTENNKFGVALLPSKTDEISGLALSLFPTNIRNTKDFLNPKHSVTVNGLLLDANPLALGINAGFIITFHYPDLIKEIVFDDNNRVKDLSNSLNNNEYKINAKINGLSISTAQITTVLINGLNISGSSFNYGFNGISLGGILNASMYSNGIQISGIANYSEKINGVQVAIFNRSKKLNGFQFGLWNINQCGSFPIVNFCFKNK